MNTKHSIIVAATLALASACGPDADRDPTPAIATGIFAPLGAIQPRATEEQRATFERGREVMARRFTPETGLGPEFNVTFCGACHERPVPGGAAGHYRDFYIERQVLADGSAITPGTRGGVVAAYGIHGLSARPSLWSQSNLVVLRNPIATFGSGLLAAIPDAEILRRADPDDLDGDGISGRPNYDQGYVGRFGVKAQTVSIEGFIRGPLFNHAGITTNPLDEAYLDALPVPSGRDGQATLRTALRTAEQAQVSAPAEPLFDDDGVPDPELSQQDLFDVVSFTMLLAAPEPDAPTEQSERGRALFVDAGCESCHAAALEGPDGLIPLYSDLLLHDMGPDLADGLEMGVATGSEFRTPPLWGVAASAPYLHDGRAATLRDATEAHGGEGQRSADAFAAMTHADQDAVIAFLESLGGRSQTSSGLLPPDAPIPSIGSPGGPTRELQGAEREAWLRGRELFDRDFAVADGMGPFFNGDSCRACHFDPTIAGSGPADVNVMRHGTWSDEGAFTAPEYGTILAKFAVPGVARREHTEAHNVFEFRQTPLALGLGVIDAVPEASILANADPDDLDGDGIRGVARILDDGRVGRLSWKSGVPSVREFVRDAMSNELGITIPAEDGQTFGFVHDSDAALDPELSSAQIDDLTFFLSNLAPPAPLRDVPAGRAAFDQASCGGCHIPTLEGAPGLVSMYSDLLLHRVGSPDYVGVPDGPIDQDQFRTPPLWGLSRTAPYMHDGSASSIEQAIAAHQGEAEASRAAYDALAASDRTALLDFLSAL